MNEIGIRPSWYSALVQATTASADFLLRNSRRRFRRMSAAVPVTCSQAPGACAGPCLGAQIRLWVEGLKG